LLVVADRTNRVNEEDNAQLYQFRFDEAEYEAGMEQFRRMFVSGLISGDASQSTTIFTRSRALT
jgi:hypothetical protein